MSRTIHTPDNGSTACVIVAGPLGALYIQALDAYGFQRELSVTLNDDPQTKYFGRFLLKVYMHPGRRDSLYMNDEQADRFVKRIEWLCANPNQVALLFNVPEVGAGRARCNGFVHLCEAVHRGESVDEILTNRL